MTNIFKKFKKSNKTVTRFIVLSCITILSGLISLFTISCEIGLGSAVDTLAPTLSIDYPPSSAIIRGTFVVSGSCGDDDTVAEVKVSLRNISTNADYGPYNANITDNSSWSININSAVPDNADGTRGGFNGWSIPDGTYIVSVTVFDGVGRSTGPFTRTIDIDNTAPIFIVKTPTTDSNNVKIFGTSIRISGTVAEKHSVSEMNLIVDNGPGNTEIQAPVSLIQSNVDVSDGAAVDFARYSIANANETAGLARDYLAVYQTVNLKNNGTTISTDQDNPANAIKGYKAGITIADNAKVYNGSSPSGDNAVGNKTSVIYLSDEVYTTLFGSSELGLSADELIACVNGTFNADTATKTSALNTLSTYEKDTTLDANKLQFKLSPSARPTYTINSLGNAITTDIDTSFSEYTNMMSGAQVTATVQGFDQNTFVKGSKLKMWLYKLADTQYGINTIKDLMDDLQNAVYSSATPVGWTQLTGSATSDEAYEISYTGALTEIDANKYYVVALTGEDVLGTCLYYDNVYIFKGTAYTNPPTINLTSPESEKYSNSTAGLLIEGTAESGGNRVGQLQVALTITNNDIAAGLPNRTQTYTINADLEDPSSYTGKFSEFANESGNLKKLKFKAALDSLISDADWKAALNSNKNLTYSLTVTATDSNGNNGSTQLQFYVDSKKPALDIREPSPVVKAYTDSEGNSHTGNFINGKVSVVLTLDDSNLTEGKYQLLVNNTPADIYNEDGTVAAVDENKWYSLGVQTTKTIIIDTTKYADGTNLKIKLNAKDAAGNEVTITSGETGVTSKECTIKQETDKPKISVRNANQNVGEIDPTDSTTIRGNLLNLNQQNFLNISLEDDDYLSSVELNLSKKGTDGVSTTPVEVPSGATWSVTTGEITSSKKYDFKPTLAGLSQGIYKVQINVKDSSFDSSATGDAATFQTEKRTALAEFWIIIDNAAPTLVENSTVFGSSENQVLITEGFTLSGTAIDTNAIYSSTVNATYPNATNKGIESVTISTGTGSSKKTWKADVSAASGATAATPGTWSKEFIVGSSSSSSSADNYLADGTYEFTIELKDIAGNTSTLTRNALIDTQKPVFKETRTSTEGEITIATTAVTSGTGDSAVKWYKTTSLDINGKAFDENGIASVKYAKFTGSFDSATGPSGLTDSDWNEISYDSATKAWDGTVPSVAHQADKVAVKLTDTAGNVSYKYTGPVNIDTLVPVRGANSLKVVYGKADSSTGATETTFVDETETAATPFAEQVISNKTKEIYVTVNLSDAAAANGNGSSGIDTDNIYLNIGSAFTGTGKPDPANKISTAVTAGTAIAYNLVLNSNTATFTIPKAKAADGNVYLRFYDKAGNYTDELLFTIVVDTIAPSASITTPATGSTLNGKKSVKGNSSDNNTAKKFALYYSTTQPSTYTKLPKEDDTQNGVETTPLTRIGSVPTSNINNWTFDSTAANAERPIVDFNTIAGVTYTATGKSKTVYLIPVVWDEAGNCNVYTVDANGNANYSYAGKYWTYTVDLDTDRPVIKTTSLSAAGETIKLNADASIEGSVTDDDSSVTAVVQHFIASSIPCTNTNFDADSIIASATTNGGVTTYTNTNVSYTPEGGSAQYDRTEFNAASGTWTYYPADNSDGDKNVYFYIKDNEGMVFYTGQLASGTDPVKMPKFRYKSTAEADAIANDAAITYKSDTQTPVISNVKLQWADENTKTADYSATQGASYNGPAGETTSVTAATRVGGPKKKYIRLIANAQDANGIDSMKLVLKGNKTTEGPSTPVTTEITAGTGTYGGSFTATSDSTPVTWKTGYIDVSDYDTGTLSITIKAIDKSALVKDSNSQVSIDNTKPEVSNFVPASSTEVTGSFDISGKSTDEGGSTLVSTKWMIPLSGDGSKTDAQLAALPTATVAEINAGGTSLDGKWVPFDSASTWSLSLTEDQAKAYDNSKYNVSSDTSGGATLYNIPFWIYAEDGNGNYVISKHTIKHNPDATIPHTQITYPSDSDYDSGRNYITLGGPIRVSGTAADNNSVSSVYLQIDHDAGPGFAGAFNKDDALWLASGSKRTSSGPVLKEYEIYDLTDPENPVVMSVADINSKPSNFAAWGIKVSGTTSWGFVINDKGELAPEAVQIDTENNNTSQTNYVRVRACSIDDENHLSAWSETINIAMDNRAPIISSSAKMYQFNKPPVATLTKNATTKVYSYSFANTSTPLSSTTYTKDMFVRNEENLWYIAIQISDEFKLKETDPVKVSRKTNGGTAIPLTASECSASNTTVGSNVFYYANYTKSNGDIDAKVIFIPVMNNVAEQAHEVSYIVSATDSDNTQHTTTSTFQFKIDNDAPVVRSLTDGNEDNLLGAEASPAIDVPVIQNSNNIYNINAKIAESGSGLKNMAFYVSRTYGTGTSAVTKVFDVTMNNRSLAETTANSPADKVNATPVSDLQSITITQTDGTSYSIYGKQFTGGTYSENGTVYTYTKAGISSDEHIRVGGLIYIDGMFRIITAKSENTDTVTFDTAATVGTTTAIFPYSHNVYSEGDDGVTSTFTESDNIYSLNAQFNSHNIPDGPVTLHFFFFDNAGNVTCKSVETEIQNNAPRIARLFLGTDLNSNGKYDDGEFNEYMAATIKAGTNDTVEQYKQDFTLTTAAATYGYGSKYKITNGLAVVPEYTGGNGSLKMVVLNNAATVTTHQTADPTNRPLITAQANNTVVTADFGTLLINEDSSTLGSENEVSKYVIANSSLPDDAEDVAMSFTFWDETDGRTQGTDSNYFFVRVTDFDIDCIDDAGPKVVINKFYWAGLNNNSIYDSSTAETVADLKGHIELEKDWNNSGHKTGTTGELDGDPKVSGRIVFTGTAYDEHTLKTLAMTVTNAAGTAITGWNNVTLATYAPATGWTVPAKTLDDNGYKFTLKYNADDYPEGSDGEKLTGFGYYENDVYLSQNGHKVYWELELDTEKFNVANDVTLRIIATDQSNGTTSSTEVTTAGDATKNIPAYRMDIVPYITSVTNSIAAKKPLYARTTLGHYPVYTTRAQNTADTRETVVVNGFNLKANYYVTFNKAKTANGSYTNYHSYDITTQLAAKTGGGFTFQIPANGISGEVVISSTAPTVTTVNNNNDTITYGGVYTLNNLNNKNSRGDYGYSVDEETNEIVDDLAFDDSTGEIGTTGSYDDYINLYNRCPNKKNNNLLTDDLYFDIWDFNTEAANTYDGRNSVLDLMMKIAPGQERIGFAFCDGDEKWAMPGGTGNSYQSFVTTADFFKSTGFTYTSDGKTFGVCAGGESGTNYADTFGLYSSSSGADNRGKASLNGYNSIRIECISQYGAKTGTDTSEKLDKDRFLSPAMAARSVTNGTDLYLAYLDNMNGEIRFRYGNIPNDSDTSAKNHGQFRDSYNDVGGNGTTPKNYSHNTNYFQILATSEGDGLGYAGEYISMGVTSGGVVVIVWYDAKNGALKYSYNTSPTTARTGNAAVGTGWQAVRTLSSHCGKFCQIAVDSENHIHIAAYDTQKADLMYFYLDSYDSTSWTTSRVDSKDGVGEYLTLDVAQDADGNQIPYIGYWRASAQKPCLAYLANPSATDKAGTDIDFYTGTWECSVIPVQSTLPDQGEKNDQRNRINVAVWKTTGGVLRKSVTGTNSVTTSDNGPGSGNCYGNGSDNPVLAYRINVGTNGRAETAQKK